MTPDYRNLLAIRMYRQRFTRHGTHGPNTSRHVFAYLWGAWVHAHTCDDADLLDRLSNIAVPTASTRVFSAEEMGG